MKQLLILSFLLAPGILNAQDNNGRIVYDEIISLDIEETELPEGMAALLPKEYKTEKVLFYNDAASLYEPAEAKEAEQNDYEEGNVKIHLERRMPEEKIFMDIANRQRVMQKDLMGRLFLISDEMQPLKWKPTGRQKMLLGQPCMEAVSLNGSDSVVAWYTTAIAVAAGPQEFYGLPGMILELWNGAHLHIIATAIGAIEEKLLKEKLKVPAKGKKITAAEFEELAKKKAEEMQQQHGGKNVIIHQIVR